MSLRSIYTEKHYSSISSYTNLLIGDIILFGAEPCKIVHTTAYGSFVGNRIYDKSKGYTKDITPSHSGMLKNILTAKEFYANWYNLEAINILNTKGVDIKVNQKCTIYLNVSHKQFGCSYISIYNCFILAIKRDYIVFEQHSSGFAGVLIDNNDIVDSRYALKGKAFIKNIDAITY